MTVAIGLIGQYSILMRSSVIETLGEDYVTTARAKGLSDDAVLRDHALPERAAADGHAHRDQPRLRHRPARSRSRSSSTGRAWAPSRSTPLSARDYPVLQGIFLLLSISVVVANLVADLLYGRLDPRVRA